MSSFFPKTQKILPQERSVSSVVVNRKKSYLVFSLKLIKLLLNIGFFVIFKSRELFGIIFLLQKPLVERARVTWKFRAKSRQTFCAKLINCDQKLMFSFFSKTEDFLKNVLFAKNFGSKSAEKFGKYHFWGFAPS